MSDEPPTEEPGAADEVAAEVPPAATEVADAPPTEEEPVAAAEEPPVAAETAEEPELEQPAVVPDVAAAAEEASDTAQAVPAVEAASEDEAAHEPAGPTAGGDVLPAGPTVDAEALRWIRSRAILPGATAAMWTTEHDDTVVEFLGAPSQRRLLVFVDPVLGLTVTPALPQVKMGQYTFFQYQ